MVLDYAILVLPIFFRRHLHFDGRSRLGLIMLLTFGGWFVSPRLITLVLLTI